MTPCEGTGWVWDPKWCGDEDHCSAQYGCECNPDYDHDHECTPECHFQSLKTATIPAWLARVLSAVTPRSSAPSVVTSTVRVPGVLPSPASSLKRTANYGL